MILFNQKPKFIIMAFSQGGFMQSEKVDLKRKLCEVKLIFLFEKSHVQTERKYFVYKEMQSLRIFLAYIFLQTEDHTCRL